MKTYLNLSTNHLQGIARFVRELRGPEALAYELIQNAEDAPGATEIRFHVTDDALIVWNDGVFTDCGHQELDHAECPNIGEFGHRCDLHSFRDVGGADKAARAGTIGAFGIGFSSVFQVTDTPELITETAHWFRDDTAREHERLVVCPGCDHCEDPLGTTFILPWARDPDSAFRRRTGLQIASPEFIDGFMDAVARVSAEAIIFLQTIDKVTVSDREHQERTVQATVRSPSRVEIEADGKTTGWTIRSSRSTELASLSRSGMYYGRRPDIAIAIPDEALAGRGRVFAQLPTQERTGLAFHINGDFIPHSNRTRLQTESPEGDWNMTVIAETARLVASNLEQLADDLGHAPLWQLLASLSAASRDEDGGVATWIGQMWSKVSSAARRAEILPTVSGETVSPVSAWILRSADEDPYAQAIDAAGLPVAVPELRHPIIGMAFKEDLGIDEVTIRGLKQYGKFEELSNAEIHNMWGEVNVLLGRRGDPEEALELDLGISRTGDRGTLAVMRRSDSLADEAFGPLTDAVAIDDRMMEPVAPDLLAVIPTLTPQDVLEVLREDPGVTAGVTAEQSVKIIGWFKAHRSELSDTDVPDLAELPLFATRQGLVPLRNASLPGGFTDPLGLAEMFTSALEEEHGRFLRDLGADELDMTSYVIRHLPQRSHLADEDPELWTEVVTLLAHEIGVLLESEDAVEILAALPLAQTHDGFKRPGLAYFASGELLKVLGGDQQLVTNVPAPVRNLLRGVGVEDQLRPHDVLARIEEVTSGEPTRQTLADVQHIVEYLADNADRYDDAVWAPLRKRAWLPAGGEDEWYRPGELATASERVLFESQATFVDVPGSGGGKKFQLLRDLGCQVGPTAEQLVKHLLHLARSQTPYPPGLLPRLDNLAKDAPLHLLNGEPCIPVENGLARPDQIYRGYEHPFGRYRYALGDHEQRFPNLWVELKIRQQPDGADALAVLNEIADEYQDTPNRTPSGEDALVVEAAWALIDDDPSIVDLDLTALSNRLCVLDADGVLVAPRLAVFNDSPTLAGAFEGRVGSNLISLPNKGANAMAGAGVRSLIASVDKTYRTRGTEGRALHAEALIRERRNSLARVFAMANMQASFFNLVTSCTLIAVDHITVQYSFTFAGGALPIQTPPIDRSAVFDSEGPRLLIARTSAEPTDLARELVIAAAGETQISHLMAYILQVLTATDEDGAQSRLDALEVPRIRELSNRTATAAILDQGNEGASSAVESFDDVVDLDGPEDDHEPDVEPLAPEDTSAEAATSSLDAERRSLEESDTEQSEELELVDDPTDEDRLATEPTDHEQDQPDVTRRGSDRAGSREIPWQSPAVDPIAHVPSQPRRHPTSVGFEAPNDGQRRSPDRGRTSRGSDRTYQVLRSWVGHAGHGDAANITHREEVDRAGVDFVLRFEIEQGRFPEEQDHHNPGFDVQSRKADGELERIIEIKSTIGSWVQRDVALSSRQLAMAQELTETYWLYVVEYATSDAPRLTRIQDPVTKITQYVFDSGWVTTGEQEGAEPDPIPMLKPSDAANPRGILLANNVHQAVDLMVGRLDPTGIPRVDAEGTLIPNRMVAIRGPNSDAALVDTMIPAILNGIEVLADPPSGPISGVCEEQDDGSVVVEVLEDSGAHERVSIEPEHIVGVIVERRGLRT